MKKLHRVSDQKWIAGICGGFGKAYDVDPLVIRLGVFALTLATGVLPFLATYLFGWLVIPDESGKAMIGGPSGQPDRESTSADES